MYCNAIKINVKSDHIKMKREKVKLNIAQCEKVGKVMKGLKFRPAFCRRRLLTVKVDEETKLRVYFYSAAICHQLYDLVNKKKNLVRWDYLEDVFLNLAEENSELLNPDHLASLSVTELKEKIKPLFFEDGNSDSCALDRLDERCRFLIEIGKILKENYDSKVVNIVKLSDGYLIKNGHGVYEILDKFEAYSDPVKKKATLFIKFMVEADLFEIKDPENFIPIMDYHRQRVLLRMGCVEVVDQELKKKLLNREKIKSDQEVKDVCIKAIRIILKTTDYGIIEAGNVFWAMGRSCCEEKTLCFDKKCNIDPCTFELTFDLLSHKKCFFEKVCKGSSNKEYRKYWQPVVDTNFY